MGAPRTGATPARARRLRADADAGIRECVNLMVDGRWVAGRSHADLAAKHGVAATTVKDWATNASRIIHHATEGEREHIRARMLATLDTVVCAAMSQTEMRGKRKVPAPDLKAATAAIAEQAKLLGLTSTRVDVVNHRVAHLTKDEHRAELEKLRGEIAAELERMAGEVA